MAKGIIYLMHNELFPDLVKIGITKGSTTADVEKRRRELSGGANMPQPFEAVFAICVNNYDQVEKVIHKGLKKLRWNPAREFFEMPLDDAINVLHGYVVSGAAVEVPVKNSFQAEEKQAIKKAEKKRKYSNYATFKQLGLPVGTELSFVKDATLKVKVATDGRIVSTPDGKTWTISMIAKRYHDQADPGNSIKGLGDGAKDFTYKGKTLYDLAIEKKRAGEV